MPIVMPIDLAKGWFYVTVRRVVIRIRQYLAFKHLAMLALFLGAGVWLVAGAEENTSLPAAETIVSNVVLRAAQVAAHKENRYFYLQTSVVEGLDDKGKVKDTKKKTYEVTLCGGAPHTRLIEVDGKPLSAKELKAEDDRDRAKRQKWEDDTQAKKDAKKQILLSAEFVDRFTYQTERREMLNGRSTFVLTFKPRSEDLPVKKTSDRVVNKLSGTVWVDAEDFEVAQADLHLAERVSMWGGLAGSLDTFNLTLCRCRSTEGVWFNQNGSVTIEGRKLFSSMHYHAYEEAAGFHKLTDEKPGH